eukprot:1054400-Prorocentrum_minimum.AAC.2
MLRAVPVTSSWTLPARPHSSSTPTRVHSRRVSGACRPALPHQYSSRGTTGPRRDLRLACDAVASVDEAPRTKKDEFRTTSLPRTWYPVTVQGFVPDTSDKPFAVRVLGEDLVVWRDLKVSRSPASSMRVSQTDHEWSVCFESTSRLPGNQAVRRLLAQFLVPGPFKSHYRLWVPR